MAWFFFTFFLVAISLTGYAHAQGVIVYQHCSYDGYSVTLPVGSYDLAELQRRGVKNDDLSSIRVPAAFRVTLYEHASYGGKSLQLTSDSSCLVSAQFNDLVSSIKVEQVGGSTWTPPSGDFSFFDEETKAGDTLASDDTPQGWLKMATSDWMGRLPDSTELRDISIPGTHDSGARFGGEACETQYWTIAQQLEAGIRYLDIRNRRTKTSFAIHHGLCYQNMMFGDVLNQIRDFLRVHPGETILMRVKEEYTPEDGSSSFSDIWDGYMRNYGYLFV